MLGRSYRLVDQVKTGTTTTRGSVCDSHYHCESHTCLFSAKCQPNFSDLVDILQEFCCSIAENMSANMYVLNHSGGSSKLCLERWVAARSLPQAAAARAAARAGRRGKVSPFRPDLPEKPSASRETLQMEVDIADVQNLIHFQKRFQTMTFLF